MSCLFQVFSVQPRAILGQKEVRLRRIARLSKADFQKDLVKLLTPLDQVICIVLDYGYRTAYVSIMENLENFMHFYVQAVSSLNETAESSLIQEGGAGCNDEVAVAERNLDLEKRNAALHQQLLKT